MTVKDIVNVLEAYAPPVYQESYDNCGLQVGNPADGVAGVLLTLDVTEEIVDEAIATGCNMIVAHHPLIFSGLKRITGRNYVERIVQKAVKNDINIYAAHTNLDNMHNGVNRKIAEKLGLQQLSILSPKPATLFKLYTYAPKTHADDVREALFSAGAGSIGKYEECSFNTDGTGTFRPESGTAPMIGEAGGKREEVAEIKIEVLVPQHARGKVLKALRNAHPYEEIAYELIALANNNQEIGAGIVGMLPAPLAAEDFFNMLKTNMKTACVRHTGWTEKRVQKVALCGGSGSFLLQDAVAAGADVFVTADYKYHQFFDAEGKIIIADIGHYESEQFTVEIFKEILNKNFPNFAVLLSKINTNPVKYFF
ncbi:Nif3-like dinuclear metal center hexameric protein [Chitinophagaceae bacterium MMS25-I14]